MTELLSCHPTEGQTEGIHAMADELRRAGHMVHTPDLYEGRVFDGFDDGLAHAAQVGFGEILDQGGRAADDLCDEIFMPAALPAQKLARSRPGGPQCGPYSHIPFSELGDSWLPGVSVQIHGMDADPIFVGEGAVEAAAPSSSLPRCGTVHPSR